MPDFWGTLFVIVFIVLSALGKRGRKGGPPAPPADAAELERAQQLRAELRRRLQLREVAVENEAEPPVAAAEGENPPEAAAVTAAPADDANARLLASYRELQARRAAEAAAGPTVATIGVDMNASPEGRAAARRDFRTAVQADLRSPVAARRALALREILGPPVGLR